MISVWRGSLELSAGGMAAFSSPLGAHNHSGGTLQEALPNQRAWGPLILYLGERMMSRQPFACLRFWIRPRAILRMAVLQGVVVLLV